MLLAIYDKKSCKGNKMYDFKQSLSKCALYYSLQVVSKYARKFDNIKCFF